MTISAPLSFQEEFLAGKPFSREYTHFSESDCPGLDLWIGRMVRSISLEFLHEILFTILSELLVNGCKANGKRVFFQKMGLDLLNPADYAKGISLYKEEFGHHRNRVFSALDTTPYRVSLTAKYLGGFIEFRVRNNCKILEEEKRRIEFRANTSLKYKNINDAYQEAVDNVESSGLGIVLIHILLRNSGLVEPFFELVTGDDFTEVVILIPKLLIPKENQTKIKELLVREVDKLPPLPLQIQKCISLVQKPDIEWSTLSIQITKDAAVTTEVIKMANSNLFGAHNKILSVTEAVKRIGLHNLESLFLALGTKKILNARFPKQILVWNHAYKTSLFIKFLLSEKKEFAKYLETAVLAGLLHDLGRMVILSLDLSQINQIRVLRSDDKNEISEWVEEYTLGTTHSEIGYLIAKKWNFPQELLDVIRFHHKPWQCNSENQILCEIVYFSDILSNVGKGKGNYYTIEPEILEKFGIHNEKDFRDLQLTFHQRFQMYQKEFEDLIH